MAPSPFVIKLALAFLNELREQGRSPRVLDLATGRGRHALALARAGFHVFAVDARFDAVADAVREARNSALPLAAWCADLTQHPLPRAHFDLVIVTRYLQRDLFPAIGEAVVPGGSVIYETFTTAQRALGTGPKSPDHLLEAGELKRAFAGFEILFYEETDGPPEAVARLLARRRS